MRLKKAADVAHVNRFQILNCSANLYFSDMAMASKIAAQFGEDEASRIAAWSVVEELIEVAENTFHRARTAEEARGAKRTIVHSSSLILSPRVGRPSLNSVILSVWSKQGRVRE